MLATARKLFRFSLLYLSGLFAVLLVETLVMKALVAFGVF
jgi:protoheme IX farnesyltransferase